MRFDSNSVWAGEPTDSDSTSPLGRAHAVAAGQYGLITLDQALSAGLTPGQVRHLVARERWRRLHSGLFVITGAAASPGQRLLAPVLAAGDGALVSHRSALWLWEIASRDVHNVEIVVPRGRRHSFAGATVHRCSDLDLTTPSTRFGIPVTNPLRAPS